MFNRYSADDLRTPILQSVGGKLAVKNVTQVSTRVFCFNDRLLQSFATQKSTSLDCLKRQAKLLKLTITKTGRSRHKCDRIWFGIGKRARVIVETEGYTTLFRFGLHLDGFYPGTSLSNCMYLNSFFIVAYLGHLLCYLLCYLHKRFVT